MSAETIDWKPDSKHAQHHYERAPVYSVEDIKASPFTGDDVIASQVFWHETPSFQDKPQAPGRLHVPLDFWAIESTQRPVHGQPIGVGGGYSAPAKIPDEFSWHVPDDVLKKRFPDGSVTPALAAALVCKPQNQGQCGSCWAFATATSAADRWAIHTMTPAVMRSASHILSCVVQDSKGCNGGYLQEAAEAIENGGLPSEACQPYTWCCGNQTPPICDKKCVSAAVKYEPIFAQLKSTHAVVSPTNDPAGTIDAIKQNIWLYGPCAAAFAVYSDFETEAGKGAVYIKKAGAKSEGGHAVSIVGWGVEAGIPFWWVRNSWSESWGIKGFFKMAMTDKKTGRNVDCGLDVPINAGMGGLFGGCTSFVFPAEKAHDVHFQSRAEAGATSDTKRFKAWQIGAAVGVSAVILYATFRYGKHVGRR